MSDQDPKMQTSSKLLIGLFLVCALICVGLIVATAFFGSPMGNSEPAPKQYQPQSQESFF